MKNVIANEIKVGTNLVERHHTYKVLGIEDDKITVRHYISGVFSNIGSFKADKLQEYVKSGEFKIQY